MDLLILVLALAVGCPLLLFLRDRFWAFQRRMEHALPEAIEHQGLAERGVDALLARLFRRPPSDMTTGAGDGAGDGDAGGAQAAVLLGRSRWALWEARLDLWRERRPGWWLAGDLLKALQPALRANLQLAPGGVVEPRRLRDELLRYVHLSLLPMLRHGPRSAYHGWTRRTKSAAR